MGAEALKWRDIVSFCDHPLQSCSKIVHCYLYTLIIFFVDEVDMIDMFWELPAVEVKQAVL